MIRFFKSKNKDDNAPPQTGDQSESNELTQSVDSSDQVEVKQSLFSRIFKTRGNFGEKLRAVFQGNSEINDDLYEQLQEQLILADVGVATSTQIVDSLQKIVKKQGIKDVMQLDHALREVMIDMLENTPDTATKEAALEYRLQHNTLQKPHVIMVVGVNGVGKTTTIAKLAYHYKQQGLNVLLAAGDTFRAAAIEQLKNWGERMQVPVIAQTHGADAAAVAFDAYNAALARQCDVLIVDTAGRQHTKDDLMEQLKKVKRVLAKNNEHVPHEVVMVVDAGYGQNVISQVQHFNDAVALTGLCVTKLDGTAKGGIILALTNQFNLPIKYIGVGEGMQDLRPFDATEFVQALYPSQTEADTPEQA